MRLKQYLRKNILKGWSICCLLWAPITACSSENNVMEPEDDFQQISIKLPDVLTVSRGEPCELQSEQGATPRTTDWLVWQSEQGISYPCHIQQVQGMTFSVKLPDDLTSGYYQVSIKREERKRLIGRTYLQLTEGSSIHPQANATLYGTVCSEKGGVAGVVVSDGIQTTVTDAQGVYQLASKKGLGYVFISIPSGYEVECKGVLPQFYQLTKGSADTAERIDFTLHEVSGQERYKLFMLGDMHLANRTNDSKQFLEFTNDLNATRTLYASSKMYAITLGDMTWDLYWYSNNYAIPDYLNTINSQLQGLQIFHVIGNHDNDYKTTSDQEAEQPFIQHIAPVYYSFNIGQIHYVVLDDIDCSAYDGTTSRNYSKQISADQLNWLARDLSYIDPKAPVVVAMHAQMFYPNETKGFQIDHDQTGSQRLLELLKGHEVHFVTGHTHLNYNVTPEASITGGEAVYEHNTGAVCGSWWWSGYLTPGTHLCPDGTPGGYAIWDIDGTDIRRLYKATGRGEEYQFRTYDLNQVSFSLADVPQMAAAVKDKFMPYVNAYPQNSDNEVLINIWNWNPRWSLSVTDEQGRTLTPQAVWAYDPQHIAALTVKRFNSSTLTSTPNFITERFTHFFKVKAADADTDLTITVRDEFGHSWTEKMERPKRMNVEQ